MSFSLKQFLFCVAVVAFGLVTLFSPKPILGTLFDLLTLGVLMAVAYGAWLYYGELRAFRVGFLCWAILYFLQYKTRFNVPIHELLNKTHGELMPPVIVPQGTGGMGGGGGSGIYGFVGALPNFHSASHSLLLLLLGLIGGWVTVFIYRKRHREIQAARQ